MPDKTVIAEPFADVFVKIGVGVPVCFPESRNHFRPLFGGDELRKVYYLIKQEKNIATVNPKVFSVAGKLSEIKIKFKLALRKLLVLRGICKKSFRRAVLSFGG